MSCPDFALDGPIAASHASQHAFLERLGRSDGGSVVARTFAGEYSVLRRAARALDAALPEAHDAYRAFLQAQGLIGAGWMENALPATQRACEDLQGLIRSPVLRDGALWAMERVGQRWAEICAARAWGKHGFWQQRSQVEEPLVPDPIDAAARDESWKQGRDAALLALATWLDALELSVTDERVA
ncbi:MAG: hypothetical protein CMJ94_15315 [Planctomycetes bacterium]|nr:hypothetical protein [Planctomycetota bacterium]